MRFGYWSASRVSDSVPSIGQVLAMVVERDRVIDELRAELAAVRAENDELKRQVGQNSKNSLRSPSGDRLNRSLSRSQQRKLDRRPGKQPGAQGFTLCRTDDPTRTEDHVAEECGGCGAGVTEAETVRVMARQVCDLPEKTTVEVVEHRMHAKRCGCGHVTDAPTPVGVGAPVQYGPRLRALAAYLVVYQHVPVARAAEPIAEVCGAAVSTGWISSVIAATGQALEPVDEAIRARLSRAHLLHVDETSINVNGVNWWIHVASTRTLTSYFLHKSRGRKAVVEFGVLPTFAGTVMHDAYAVYDGEEFAAAVHALCGAHISRELVAAGEADPDNPWPKAALDAYFDLNTAARAARDNELPAIPEKILDPLLGRWRHALLCGLADNPRRDGRKQSKTRNLLERLTSRGDEVLRFATDLTVPFTNNLAEVRYEVARDEWINRWEGRLMTLAC